MTNYKVKSVTVSRKPSCTKDGSWSAFIGLFNENNPHLTAREPLDVLEIKGIEKVRINELRNVSYYLEGNDVIVNNLVEVDVEVKDNIVTLTGKQEI